MPRNKHKVKGRDYVRVVKTNAHCLVTKVLVTYQTVGWITARIGDGHKQQIDLYIPKHGRPGLTYRLPIDSVHKATIYDKQVCHVIARGYVEYSALSSYTTTQGGLDYVKRLVKNAGFSTKLLQYRFESNKTNTVTLPRLFIPIEIFYILNQCIEYEFSEESVAALLKVCRSNIVRDAMQSATALNEHEFRAFASTIVETFSKGMGAERDTSKSTTNCNRVVTPIYMQRLDRTKRNRK